mmetsp:Transcript_13042/g.18154  ORF Transcript_13042/g.18154 Transcript_13042/m.18154 type:complete len:187 (+) Transcript_13042:63-623(+)
MGNKPATSKDDMHPDDIARFVVNIKEVKEVVKMDVLGHCDPYFVMKYGEQEQTTSIKENCSEAVYDEEFEFLVEPGVNKLTIFAMDKDMLSSQQFGKTIFDLQHTPIKGWIPMFDENAKKIGCTLKLSITYYDPLTPAHIIAAKAHGCWGGVSRAFNDVCRHPDETAVSTKAPAQQQAPAAPHWRG